MREKIKDKREEVKKEKSVDRYDINHYIDRYNMNY